MTKVKEGCLFKGLQGCTNVKNVINPVQRTLTFLICVFTLVVGNLRAINPENGFFGVAPGTSAKTNPNAMVTIIKNTIFTNVAETSDGGVYWEGMDQSLPEGVTITSWKNKPWRSEDGKQLFDFKQQLTKEEKEARLQDV